MTPKKNELTIEIEQTEKEKILFAENNDRKKAQLIGEIKMGLGAEIKKNPGKAKIIKKTRAEKFKLWLKNIFTKF
jgi:hypothetical protein